MKKSGNSGNTTGDLRIGSGCPVRIIAEIGTAHQGDLKKAYALIDSAAEAGADCAKFQIVYADEIIHAETGNVDLPGGSIPLYRRFKELERDIDFYEGLKTYTEKKGLFFLCTPFGIKSARILKDLNAAIIKIASPELNYIQLLEEVSGYGIPVILSTGVSTLCDIETALSITGENSILMHCVTSYPAPVEQYNLRLIPNLRRIFGIPCGVSDHTLNPVLIPALAAASGGCVIEKHFTLSREGDGLDDPVALDPGMFKVMVNAVREAESAGLNETKERLSTEYGQKKITRILGNGVKRIAPVEKAHYSTTNRSIRALYRLPAGTILTKENTAILRSEQNLSPGLLPIFLPDIIGRKTAAEIPPGEGIRWKDIK